MSEERIIKLEERLELLEFKVEMLAEKSRVGDILFESNLTREQYKGIMDLMDESRKHIDNNEKVHHYDFETKIDKITGQNGDYHFCENLAQAFMEDGRWEEVFPALYGDMPKFKYYMERRLKGEE